MLVPRGGACLHAQLLVPDGLGGGRGRWKTMKVMKMMIRGRAESQPDVMER